MIKLGLSIDDDRMDEEEDKLPGLEQTQNTEEGARSKMEEVD